MEKRLTCKNLGYECDYMVRDESEEQILKKFADHAENIHKVTFTKELRERAKSLIREAA